MRNLYETNPMNSPRLDTDTHFVDYSAEYKHTGFIDKAYKFIEDFQLLNPVTWERFVKQFREADADFDGGWRGEYWGKCMRGASFVYSYSKNPELYALLKKTVIDMMDSARVDEEGRISSYGKSHEFCHWDIWERKYVLLGMQYFYEICPEQDLRDRIIESMKTQVDCIIKYIGDPKQGKKRIVKATHHWRGLNSSSLLEPIVRLYTLTGEQRFFDFAEYIVSEGGCEVANIFDLAYQNDFKPYQYPITKAYEMTSCFEGLLEFYRITKIEKYKTALINFADAILETDFTVIGCCGCTHELFDHSTVRQANTTNEAVMQETCVTVTLMKFFYQLHILTGDPKYIDAFEISLYNAYLGSINTEKVIDPSVMRKFPGLNYEPLPFDSYSPLTAGKRGLWVGGFMVMSDKHYYGCCACIGAAGIGLIPKVETLLSDEALVINLFMPGAAKLTTPKGNPLSLTIDTEYPKNGKVCFTVDLNRPEEFLIKIRNPYWSKNTTISVNGAPVDTESGYITVNKEWCDGDKIELSLDMRTEAILPIPYGTEILNNKVIWGANYMVATFDKEDPIARNHIAFRRGPVMLAQENRLGYSVDDPITILPDADGFVEFTLSEGKSPYECVVEGYLPLADGTKMLVTDYGSAGKLWTDESKMAVWMLTK